MRLCARHYNTGELIDVVVENGRIISIDAVDLTCTPDREGQWVAPALFDLQINGCGGHNFTSESLSDEAVHTVVAQCRQHGITAFCPTLITSSPATLLQGFTTLRRLRESDRALAKAMPAFHLEGPYINPEDGPRGAHPRHHVRRPDLDEFRRLQDAAGGLIRLVTLAPDQEVPYPLSKR